MPWRGGWGALGDGRSKISRLRKQIDAVLTEEYQPRSSHARRQVRRAATLAALCEATGASIGSDPKATPRRLTGLERAASGVLAKLDRDREASQNGRGQDPAQLWAELRGGPA